MNIIFVVLFLACPLTGWAGQVSLIEHDASVDNKAGERHAVPVQDKKKDQSQEQPVDGNFDQMKEFLRQENERLKTIKILNLDLERANLEFKKKEIEIKLADLNKGGGTSNPAANSGQPSALSVEGIFVNGTSQWAFMNVNGTRVQVKPGQTMRDGTVIKEINTDAVIVQYSDARKEIIHAQ